MPRTTPRIIFVLSAAVLTTVLGGCATTATSPETTTASGNADFPREAMKQLRPGMTPLQVIHLVGQPAEKDLPNENNGNIETWRYFNTTDPIYREIAVEMEEVFYTDPINGITRTILEPRSQMERITMRETFSLTFNKQGILADLNYDAVRSSDR